MSMIATYERNSALNVREHPAKDAPIIDQMHTGDAAEVAVVRGGWCELVPEGYVRADLVTITLEDAPDAEPEAIEPETVEETEAAAEDAAEAVADAQEQVPDAEPEAEEADAADDVDEAAELRKMSNPELYDLCVNSGIKVKKGAKKEELIDAILGRNA